MQIGRGAATSEGSLPPGPVTLMFLTLAASERTEGLQSSVREALGPLGELRSALATQSIAHGEFRFRGLTGPITGQIQWLGPYLLDGPGTEPTRAGLSIQAPIEVVTTRLIRGIDSACEWSTCRAGQCLSDRCSRERSAPDPC